MEKNFTNENFERFLQQNADHLRMRPSDKIWKNVSRNLNRKKKRIGIALTTLLLTGSMLAWYVVEEAGHGTTPVPSIAVTQTPDGSALSTGPASGTSVDVQATAPRQSSPSSSNSRIPSLNRSVIQRNTIPVLSTPATIVSETANIPAEEITAATTPVGAASETPFEGTIVDSDMPEKETDDATASSAEPVTEELPMTIESVINSFSPRKRRVTGQFYFTPTVSYRKLTERRDNGNASAYNVNNIVTHKPDMGFELGMAMKYRVTDKVKIRAGLQFNINRYDIKAFNATTELTTIALSTGRRIDSMSAASSYRNFNGNRTNWLQNYYLQLSAPIGVEYQIKGDERMQFGVAGTLQPVYVLGDKAYLISSDYKNYAEVPSLVRRWNVASSLEAYVSYPTGRLKWQVGPQVRYQLLSSFSKQYPVTENLFDFGLKVGVSMNR
jgi:hypothetical protein